MRAILRSLGAVPAAVLVMMLSVRLALANCATDDPTGAQVLAARQTANSMCLCATFTSHGAYVSCVAGVAKRLSSGTNPSLPPSCKRAVKKCAAHSTCGKPGFVNCCFTTTSGTKCRREADALRCTVKHLAAHGKKVVLQGTVGMCTSCCDACPAPGSGPSCPTTTTTTATTTTTTTTTIVPFCSTTCGLPCDPSCGDSACFVNAG